MHLASKARRFEAPFNEQRDLVDIERLLRVVKGTVLHRFNGDLDARVPGEHDDNGFRAGLLDLLEDRQSVGVGQTVVEHHQVQPFAAPLVCLSRRFSFEDAIAFLREATRQRPANQLVVVDDKDGWGLHNRRSV